MNDIDTPAALGLYREMLRIRLVEEHIVTLYGEQEMRCPVHLCIGQEAVPAGVCANLRPTDPCLSGHRSHGHFLAKGGDLKAMIAEIYGKADGCANGKGGSMHLIDLDAGFIGATPIVGSTIPIAMGAAFEAWRKDSDQVAVAFFGDAATETGVFHETLNYASTLRLPLVLVCENNLYSVYSPLDVRQPDNRTIAEIGRAHGMAAAAGDGNDVLEVHALAGEAVARARSGGGPTLLEFQTYRWREHCGPMYDNDIGYRTPEEFESWRVLCPVERMKRRLVDAFGVAPDELDGMADTIQTEIEAAFAHAKQSPFPDPGDMALGVYATR